METLNPRFVSLVSNRCSIQIYTNKNPPILFNFRVSARLHSPRKNHLRQKLIQQQVRLNSTLPNPNPHTQDDTVSNDEILPIEPSIYNVKNKTFHPKDMEKGINSSVANLGSLITVKPSFIAGIGVSVFCGFLVFIAFKSLFRKEKVVKEEYSSLEKEMLRRKIKARMAKQDSIKASVEVIQDSKEPPSAMVFKETPRLDKEELMNSIANVKTLDKIQEIRAMAREAREIESNESFDVLIQQDVGSSSRLDVPDINGIGVEAREIESNESFDAPIQQDVGSSSRLDVPNINDIGVEAREIESNESFDVSIQQDVGSSSTLNVPNINDIGVEAREIESNESFDVSIQQDVGSSSTLNVPNINDIGVEAREIESNESFDVSIQQDVGSSLRLDVSNINDIGVEAREIESNESFDVLIQQDVGSSSGLDVPNINDIGVEGKDSNLFDTEKESAGVKLKIISSVKEAREYLHKKQEPKINNLHETSSNDDVFGNRAPTSLGGNEDVLINGVNSKNESVKGSDGELARANREKWIEDNFHEFEPLVEKIRGGFRNNYMVAREKVKEDMNLVLELERDEKESEFEWMKDEKLREVVFQVRENELMGRDPFYLMDAQDKALFFKGLEKRVEKENEKLAHLHEYLHSNIENLDYGADGISLYDSPEKIIPRWKGPPPATTMSQEFLDDYLDQRKTLFAETLGNLDLDSQNLVQRSDEKVESKNLKSSKTVIEGSDGSVKPGKKSGKEFWQHTKKWSRGFLDSYNAESDPEIKAAMKDIGKDLDRWITEKEIQEAADFMDKVPDKGKKFIAEKVNKLKREMELFGPQAVVSKYSEYGDEEEIDYYWWLDLPFLLCIEIYTDGDEDKDERIGFYSLEMASDLELDPKPHHIIAFEDAGDCKNLCYIIQTHMEMLGNGNAFVVPQLPKDTYQEAKGNGFNVTVIRKGELKLDVDQTLEEVEEKIVEIGSKMYHDKIMKSRNVDVDSLMKGVFGLKKTTNKNRRLKKPTK